MLLLHQMWYSSIDQVMGKGLPCCHQITVTRVLFTASCAGTDLTWKVPVRKYSLVIIAKHRLYDKHMRICKAYVAVASEDTQRVMWPCLCGIEALVDSHH